MNIQYEILSDIGNRERNEDYADVKINARGFLAVVADGLGGHEKGEIASKLVTDTMMSEVNFDAIDYQKELHRIMQKAQKELLELQQKEKKIDAMKTTGVSLFINSKEAYLGHIGDSRGYVFYKNGKIERTSDHSVPQLLFLSGTLKEKQIRYHEDRNKLLRVFGMRWEKDACELKTPVNISKVKAFLLCTDGFWELINEKQMKQCLYFSFTPKQWMERMLKIINKTKNNGIRDNYTAITIFIR